jgi:hypothetical protein
VNKYKIFFLKKEESYVDKKLSKQLDIIIESKIGDLWSSLPPEAKTGIVVGGVVSGIGAGIPALITGIHSLFSLFREKCKRRCEALRGEKQYNICYYACKRNGISQCIRKLEVAKTKCKDDKCKNKISQEIATWRDKLVEIEKRIKKI